MPSPRPGLRRAAIVGVAVATLAGLLAVPISAATTSIIDGDAIDPTHAYGLVPTLVDGTGTWEHRIGEPVITGDPTSPR